MTAPSTASTEFAIANAYASPGTEPVFAEPWQAQAFAMVVHLHARGLFTWTEWAQALAATIAADTCPDPDGAVYYQHWLAALEQLVAEKGAASNAELATCAAAWDHAADRTPHGEPIILQRSDYGAAGREAIV